MKPSFPKLYFKLLVALTLSVVLILSGTADVFAQKKSGSSKRSKTVRKKRNAKRAADSKAARKRAAEAKRRAEAERKRRQRQLHLRKQREKRQRFEKSLRLETRKNIDEDERSFEDPVIRRAAISALGSRAGTVLVMNAQTGRVISIVNQDWAVRKSFKPCSTVKLVTALAGVNEGAISFDGSLDSHRLSLGEALAYSNNKYFQLVGTDIGNEAMIDYARQLGLGERTGINLPSESSGKLPFGNSSARVYSHGDSVRVSALQLGVMVSAITNGGTIVVPQVASSRIRRTSFRGYYKRQLKLPGESLTALIPGMIGATDYGTARRGTDDSLRIAGKTGSCIAHGSWIGLFASVAPVDNPKFAVVVITRGQKERGRHAAAVAGEVYRALAGRLGMRADPRSARRLGRFDGANGARKMSPKRVARAEVPQEGRRPVAIQRSKPKNSKSASSKKISEMFPPIIIRTPGNGTTRPRVVEERRNDF